LRNLIITADDWGRSGAETNAALDCYLQGALTTVSAMVFMDDSERAADLARENAVPTGLHLNFTQCFSASCTSSRLRDCQRRVQRFLLSSKFALLLYNPFLRKDFSYLCESQTEQFVKLYGQMPAHIDGHQHMHLCSNLLLAYSYPLGQRVRRSFTFHAGEKSFMNRGYRMLVDRWLKRRYVITDFFFSLSHYLCFEKLARVVELAKLATVELMTHPIRHEEYNFLLSGEYQAAVVALMCSTGLAHNVVAAKGAGAPSSFEK
jgi:predicted glycoside hydrolase/deacetylase ChbG (UPF0249 family)